MKSLLQSADQAEVLKRIHALRPDTPALWGKMNAAQMLTHSQIALKTAMGEVQLRRHLIGILFGRLAKRTLMRDVPFKRNLPTAKAFRIGDARDFAIEKANLIALLQRFQQGGPAGITRRAHPFFGPLTVTEWETLQWKHLDHHLRQFGV